MTIRIWLALVCALLAGTVAAATSGSRADVRKTIENSMLITGVIEIEKDGSVGQHRIDEPEKLPPAVVQLLARAVPDFRFEPVQVGGKIVRARSRLGVRIAARQLENGDYEVRIASASFGEDPKKLAEKHIANSRKKLTPPRYPPAAAMNRISGTVYLIVKIDEKGDVDDVATEQVNLTVLGTPDQMEQARKVLSAASISGARRWRFNPPAREDLGDDGYLMVRVPIDFKLWGQKTANYGEWEAYVPGPRQRPAWVDPSETMQNPDAMIAGVEYPLDGGPRLLTPLGGS